MGSAARRLAGDRVRGSAGSLALAAIVLGTAAIVLAAAAGPSALVPRSTEAFPTWEAGPLHGLIAPPFRDPILLGRAFTLVLLVMLAAWGVVVLSAPSLSLRILIGVVVLLHVVLLLGPPLQLTDLFNYLGYARLGGLHELNPYTHVIADVGTDPVQRFTDWHHLRSPYGELFTALTYPFSFLSLALASWLLKGLIVVSSLGFLWLLVDCARRLGHDPRRVLALVALNPITVIYAVGGFHNDYLMLVPTLAAVALVLRGRDRAAGAMVVLAIAVKFTAVLLAPFLLIAVAGGLRRRHLVEGALVCLVACAVGDVLLFGSALPNLGQQSALVSALGVPNLVGLIFGVGATHLVVRLADVLVLVVLVAQLRRARRTGDWLTAAGWTTLALVLSLSWTVPWYAVWVLPLAALAPSRRLRGAVALLTVYLVCAFVPVTTQYLYDHSIDLLNTPAGHASRSLQGRLAH